MELSDTEMRLIRESYLAVRDEIEAASAGFYHRLFEVSPDMRPMFRGDVGDQGMRFMASLGVIVRNLDQKQRLDERLEELGSGHAALGVSAEQYEIMTGVLIDTLAAHAGAAWSPETEAAWSRALDQVASAMQGKA